MNSKQEGWKMHYVVLITTKNNREAERIAQKLVEDKLVACVNIVAKIQSIFWWQGRVCNEQEALMILKTRKNCFKGLVQAVKSLHSYTVPEIIALPIVEGNADYLKWIDQSVSGIKKN